MAWYDYAGLPATYYTLASKALGGKGLSGDAKSAWNWGQERPTAPQIGPNPYQGQWDSLITQLQNQANPNNTGPSLAGNAYKQAQQTGMNNVLSMSRGGSAGAARMGMQTLGRMNQGLSQGYSNARLQEQLAAQQQLQGALSGAGNAWFQPQSANLNAQLNTPSNMQMLMQFLQQLGTSGATLAGKGAAGAGGV